MFVYLPRAINTGTRGKLKNQGVPITRMMSDQTTICPLRTTIFFKPENSELISQNLWQPLPLDQAQQFDIDGEQKEAIGLVPDNVVIHSFEKFEDHIICWGSTTELTPPDTTIKVVLQLERRLSTQESRHLMDLASELDIDFVVTSSSLYSEGPESSGHRQVYMLGSENRVNAAKPQVLAFLALAQGKIVRCVSIESPVLLPACAGVGLTNLKHFSAFYGTDIIIPDFWVGDHNNVFLSGDAHSLVLLAEERLTNLLNLAKKNLLYSEMHNISLTKLLFISRFCRPQLTNIMQEQRCFINISGSDIHFTANSTHALDSAMKQLTLELLTTTYEVQLLFPGLQNDTSSSHLKSKLSEMASGANVIILQPQCTVFSVVLVGNSHDVLKCLHFMEVLCSEMEVQIKFLVELYPDYKDFISGKKNGKISRITDNAKCVLSLEFQEDQSNMLITLTSNSFAAANAGINLLGEELPAEISFFIPEAYHRPVIGTGGSVIQTIMRRFNVFIQFSNTFQLPQNDFGLTRHNNVVIRCPSKNRKSISQAKKELMRLVNEYSNQQPKTCLRFSPGQYRFYFQDCNHFKHNLIAELEKKTGVYIKFPTELPKKEWSLEIRGSEQNSKNAASEMAKTFASEREIVMSDNLTDTLNFTNIVVASLQRLNIETCLYGNTIMLTYPETGSPQIDKALDILESYIASKEIQIKWQKKLDTNYIIESDSSSQMEVFSG